LTVQVGEIIRRESTGAAAWLRGRFALAAVVATLEDEGDADEAWKAALSTTALDALSSSSKQHHIDDDLEEVALLLLNSANAFCRALLSPLGSGEVFGVRAVEAARSRLGLTPVEAGVALAAWFESTPAATAAVKARPRQSNATVRWLSNLFKEQQEDIATVMSKIHGVVEAAMGGFSNASGLGHQRGFALAALLLEAERAVALSVEKKSYGALPREDWANVITQLSTRCRKLRVATLLSLGPPRNKNVSVDMLSSETISIASILAVDAACAGGESVGRLDAYCPEECSAIARLAGRRPERGWLHNCFPGLDPCALRCAHALHLLSGDNNMSSRERLAYAARELYAAAAEATPPQRLVAAACASKLWSVALAKALTKALADDDDDDVSSIVQEEEEEDLKRRRSLGLLQQAVAAVLCVVEIGAAAQDADTALERRAACLIFDDDVDDNASCWPSRCASEEVRDAWACRAPSNPKRLKQLGALSQAMELGLSADLLPLSNLAHLFGLSSSSCLDLATAPDDDAAAFAGVALAATRQAAATPEAATNFRRTAAKHRVDALDKNGHFSDKNKA
jgi:hypothetical protein